MSSRKNPKGTNGNKKTRKHKLISNSKNIDDYLHDSLFPISPNEYITITLEICSELKGNPKYNYKVSSIKKHTFTQDIPDYNKYSSLTMEALQEGIDKLNLKDPNSFIRLMLISRGEELKIWKLDNQKYEENTNNKEKCGYGTSIYEEIVPPVEKDLTIEDMEDWDIFEKELDDKNKQQVKENEARKLQAEEARVAAEAKAEEARIATEAKAEEERLAEEARVADEANEKEEQFAEESVVDYIPAPVVADEDRIAAEAKAEEARVADEANAKEEQFAEESVVDYIPAPVVAAEAKAEEERLAEEARVADELLLKSLSKKDFFDYEDDADNGPWHNTKQELLKRIDKITDQVKQTKYEDDKTEISDNMDLLKVLVDELGNSYKLLTPIIDNIDPELGKNKCDTARTYIEDNRGENIYKDNLYDDYAMVNNKYETYITYQAGWLSRNEFEKHKNNFINELDNFKKNLKDKVFSTFEYGDSEYCKDISPNNNDDLIKSVEDANKRAETVLSQDDSVINRVNPDKNTLLRSNSAHSGLREPSFSQPTRNEIKQFTALPGFINKAKNQKMNKDEAFNLWNKGKPSSRHETLHRFSSYWDLDKQTGKGKKTKKKRTTRSKKQKSNTKTVKNMERKRKTRKNTK